MNRCFYRFAFAASFAAAGLLASSALANGRFPAADQLIIDPEDPTHIVVRTTYGFVESRDAGKTWLWTCEEIIGRIANQDPPFTVTGDGSVVVAVPFEGVSVTHDHGCTWARASDPLAGQLAVDVTLEPNDPSRVVVLTSTNDTNPDAGPNAPAEFRNLVVETKDNGVTWALRGAPLARDLIAATIEIAPTDPNRIYVSGVLGDPLRGVIDRSEDGGNTWTRTPVPTVAGLSSVYISAVDGKNPDRLYLRVLLEGDPVTMATPTTLFASNDKGTTWKEIVKTDEAMLGFALSPDGSKIAYGTIGQGVFLGPSDGSAAFAQVGDIQNRCLTWSPAGLYACNTDLGGVTPLPRTSFAVGLSHDMGASYETLYRLYQTCPTTCPDESRFNQVCRNTWQTIPGVTTATGATGETCTVSWAKTLADGGSSGAGGVGGGGGTGGAGAAGAGGTGARNDAGTLPPVVEPDMSTSCSCRIAAAVGGGARAGAGAFALAALASWMRRRSRWLGTSPGGSRAAAKP